MRPRSTATENNWNSSSTSYTKGTAVYRVSCTRSACDSLAVAAVGPTLVQSEWTGSVERSKLTLLSIFELRWPPRGSLASAWRPYTQRAGGLENGIWKTEAPDCKEEQQPTGGRVAQAQGKPRCTFRHLSSRICYESGTHRLSKLQETPSHRIRCGFQKRKRQASWRVAIKSNRLRCYHSDKGFSNNAEIKQQ